MDEQEVIKLLSHYRHDWLNDVQLITGYASMGNLEKVQCLLKQSIALRDEERKLTNLNIPKTALWIISFNWSYDNFRITYEVNVDNKNLSTYDNLLHTRLTKIMDIFTIHGDSLELYNGNFQIIEDGGITTIELVFTGVFKETGNLNNQLGKIGLDRVEWKSLSDAKYKCTIKWMLS